MVKGVKMKTKRKRISRGLKKQIKWAESLRSEELKMMLLDGKSITICGCEIINEETCPHGNMNALQLLMLQLSKEELEKQKS